MEQKLLIKNILSAAEQGHKKALKDYISRRVVNVVDEEGSTPLIYAAANGREDIVRLLLDEECVTSNKLEYNTETKYIDQQNVYGWTALMQAACYGHLNVVIPLIQRGADVNVKNTWGASALVGASQGGFFGVVHKLLNVGAEVNPVDGSEGADTLTPLMAATQCGHVEIVAELLRRGANVDTKLKGTLWTALMLAALNNQLPVMEMLLKHGADKSASDINGQTAADLATALGHEDMVLLLTGKKPKECSEGEFFDLVKSGDLDRVSKVLETQKRIANCQDKDGVTPLMLAANKGNVKMCELLLDRGANANTKDEKYGWTALMLATHQRKYDVVQLLGERGAAVNVRGKSGSTAFDVANMISDIKMIRLVANISVEQIQRKEPDAAPPLAIPALSGGLDAMVQAHPSSEASSDVGVAKPEVNAVNGGVADSSDKKSEPPTIDLTDLKHKLDKAYRTPTPSICVDKEEPSTKESSAQPRFPKKPQSVPSLRQPIRSIPSSLSSSIVSEVSSPSSSTSSFASERLGVGDPFSDKSTPSSPSSSSVFTRRKPPSSIFMKGGQLNRSPAHKSTAQPRLLSSPGPSRSSSSALLQPKFSPGSKTASLTRSKLKEPPLFSPLRSEGGGVSVSRRRADTAPTRSGKGKKRASLPKPPSGIEIKNALEQESLGHLYPIFLEQEMDMIVFLTLNGSDLKELGVGSEDTERVLALIARLKAMSPALTPSSALASPGPVFTFIP